MKRIRNARTCFTVHTSVSISAATGIPINDCGARRTVFTRVTRALIDIYAQESIGINMMRHSNNTLYLKSAQRGGEPVLTCFAMNSSITVSAEANVSVDFVNTCTFVLARTAAAFVDICNDVS